MTSDIYRRERHLPLELSPVSGSLKHDWFQLLQWRGHSNSGHCTVGCNSGEVEIATLATGCKHSGWQSACCEATESTEPWSKCKWTDLCFDDDTCPSGYSSLVAKSREGWSGRRSCKNGKQYNYCCSETPKAFKNCKWVGDAVKLLNENYCSDACPHGSTRIAEEQVYTLFGSNKTANSMDCVDGAEAYCCAGDYESDEDEQPTIVYRDETAREFDRLLQKFLSDPVCPEEIQSQFGFDGGMSRRDLGKRATDQTAVLHELVPIMETWLTSNPPRADMEDVWQGNLQRFELQSTAANVSTYTDLLYPGGRNGLPVYNPTLVIVETLCNLGQSRDALDGMALASQALCEIPSDDTGPGSDKRHLLVPRRLDGFTNTDRSANKVEPSIINAIRGARTGQLSLHYMRWIQSRPNNAPPTQVILEMAFWIGPDPGVDPGQAFRDVYSDRSHTLMPDRWIIFHFHIPLNPQTFYVGGQRWLLGVDTFSMYHSHDIRRPTPVDSGTGPDYRAEFVYTSSYISGTLNVPPYTDYNTRTQPFNCRNIPGHNSQRPGGLWYVGMDYRNVIARLRNSRAHGDIASEVNQFGIWLYAQGAFSTQNLARIWPRITTLALPRQGQNLGSNQYRPVPGAFDVNWLPGGNGPLDLSQADP